MKLNIILNAFLTVKRCAICIDNLFVTHKTVYKLFCKLHRKTNKAQNKRPWLKPTWFAKMWSGSWDCNCCSAFFPCSVSCLNAVAHLINISFHKFCSLIFCNIINVCREQRSISTTAWDTKKHYAKYYFYRDLHKKVWQNVLRKTEN